MSDLAKALDAAERAYATDPSAQNWKRITDAKLAVDQEKTRAAALARIAADEAAAKAEAEKQKLRDELAALSPTLNARAFFAVLATERKAVHAARIALSQAHGALRAHVGDYEEARERAVELHKALGMSPPAHEPMSMIKAEAMVTFDAQTLPLHSLLVRPTALPDCASELGVSGGGLDAATRGRFDGYAIELAAIRDKLTGSTQIDEFRSTADAEQQRARVAQAARVAALASVKGVPGNTPDSLAALAGTAAERALKAHDASTTTATEANLHDRPRTHRKAVWTHRRAAHRHVAARAGARHRREPLE